MLKSMITGATLPTAVYQRLRSSVYFPFSLFIVHLCLLQGYSNREVRYAAIFLMILTYIVPERMLSLLIQEVIIFLYILFIILALMGISKLKLWMQKIS